MGNIPLMFQTTAEARTKLLMPFYILRRVTYALHIERIDGKKSRNILFSLGLFRFFSVIQNFKPIKAQGYFSIPPENIRKPKDFLMFSEDIEKQHRAVTV